ncbi:hypothetical protein KQX54_002218 [Cotesia glomerata]|uniref:Uncharacterized protein n=1 Tax=Cotesia glomerata TaxID=32391 RepID=A0AAV7HU93_COTGL|nr:hypothetical protein KQX54_002218 [Cotesia glomerata]
MYEFKPFSLVDRNSPAYPMLYIGYLFISCDNNNLYIYDEKFPGILSYNLSTNLWVELISLKNNLSPTEGKIIAIIKENNLIKIFSQKNLTNVSKAQLHICNLDTKEVVKQNLNGFVPDNDSICRRNIFYYNNCYYTVLRCRQSIGEAFYDLKIYRLNLDTYTWEYVNKLTAILLSYEKKSSSVGVVYNNDKLYLFMSYNLHYLWVFDLKTNAWDATHISLDDKHVHEDKIFPKSREYYSMLSYVDPDTNDTCLIVSGGENLRTYNADSAIWKFNLTSLKWYFLGKFRDLEHQCYFRRWACVTPRGKLVTCDESSDDRRSRNIFSRKVYSAWTRVPTLEDICWDAVLYYHPDLPNESKDDIQIKYGIPWNFLQKRLK